MRPCFAFSDSQAPEAPAKLSIYDEIGFWGVQAADFRTALSAVTTSSLDVEINSPGGDAFAGLAMYNMLRNSGKTVNVKIMGVAASAASLIAMAGDTISMPANTFMMVHNPYWCVQGNAADLRDSADALDKIQTSLTATYVAKTGMAEADMQALLSKDSWLTAAECLEKGFCTEVTADLFATAKFDSARAELPANVKLALTAPIAEVPAEVVVEVEKVEDLELDIDAALEGMPLAVHTLVVAAGLEPFAANWAVQYDNIADAEARVASAKSITSLCAMACRPSDATAHIKANTPLAAVRAALVRAMAQADEDTHTDTTPVSTSQTTRTTAKPAVTVKTAWASHNAQKRKT